MLGIVQFFDPREVDMNAIDLPSNLPSFFTPHFFPQIIGDGSAGEETYSVQWQKTETGQTWTPSVWTSKCNSLEDTLVKVPNSKVEFTGLYISASKALRCFSAVALIFIWLRTAPRPAGQQARLAGAIAQHSVPSPN